MFSSPTAHRSADNLASISPSGSRSEFPFPRLGPGNLHPVGRRGSTASSVHSIGGALDTSTGGWSHSLAESGQNAISTLLQPPIVRTGLLPHTSAPASTAHKPPTARDIPPVTLTNIDHVDSADFKPYLSQVGALYEQLRRVKEQEEDGGGRPRRGSKNDEGDADESHLKPGGRAARRSSVNSFTSISSLEASSPLRRSTSGVSRRGAQGPPPLSTIPTVYFDEDFHLENPRTFDVVSERSEVVRPVPGSADDKSASNGSAAAPRKALATNAILQEKLSWYMDTIEIHLINSISTASTTFFTALGSLRELHSEAADSVDRIKTLRQELEALDREIAQSGLDIVQKRRRRENIQQLNDAVLQLRCIVEGVSACETLVDEGEVERALEKIDSLEKLMTGEASDEADSATAKGSSLAGVQLRDLKGASALKGVNDDLDTLRSRIGKAYETKFINVLMDDLRRHLDSVLHSEVLLRWGSASARARGSHSREPSVFPTYLSSTGELRAAILPNLVGLHRAKHIATATSAYREAVLREVRNLIRKPLPSSNDDDNESMMSASTMSGGRGMSSKEKSSILARNLRALDSKDAEDLLKSVYISVTETLRRLTTQVKVLLDVASSLSGSSNASIKSPSSVQSPIMSPKADRRSTQDISAFEIQEEIHQAMDVANLMGQAVDVAQDKIVKVLKVRAEQSAQLPLVWFLRYFTLNLYFANECEAISGRGGTPLKTLVNGHIKDFMQRHGDAEKQKLAQGMESDQWNAKDFNERDTELLGRVLESSTKTAEAWSDGTKIWTQLTLEDEVLNGGTESAATGTNGTGKDKTRSAVVEGESFLLPNSAILCLEGTSHFMHLISGIPTMTTDVATSLIGYFHLFNSRCTQLILGAGATRSAGLKNITTRHLALASQALGFIVTLMPHVREFVRRHAGSGAGVSNLMGEFDKVRRLFQEHQNSIYDKLVDIMSGRAAQHSKTMKTINWDEDGSGSAASAAHPYMETLAKETTTLHRVLTKHLPEGSVQMIMSPVFASYKDQLGKVFQAAEPKTPAGRDSMRRDVDLFVSKLGKIEGFGTTGDHLLGIINAKKVDEPEKAESSPPPPPPLKPSEEGKQEGEEEAPPDEEGTETPAVSGDNAGEKDADAKEESNQEATSVDKSEGEKGEG